MTLDEEREFLAPWLKLALSGSLRVVSPLRAALAARVGQPVKASLVYRILARHGWRKVAPDTRAPPCRRSGTDKKHLRLALDRWTQLERELEWAPTSSCPVSNQPGEVQPVPWLCSS